MSELRILASGLDQGNPSSSILFLIYNAGLIDITQDAALSLLFVNDSTLLLTGSSFQVTHTAIQQTTTREGGVLNWATEHNCEFGIEKFQLCNFTRRRVCDTSLLLYFGWSTRQCNRMVPAPPTAQFLGVLFDNELWWGPQRAAVLVKGQRWVQQVSRLARPSKGTSGACLRRLYILQAVPRTLYATDLFLTPPDLTKPPSALHGLSKMRSLQRQATLLMTGGLHSSPADALDVLAGLLPSHILLTKHQHCALLQYCTLPKTNPIYHIVSFSHNHRWLHSHNAPLHLLFHAF
ncbi:hypothetical protein BDQ17DRAFT_1257723, partial [Cyathus striatus]